LVSQIFSSSGAVYRAFLFHIARPADYPIWDQNVARVHALLTERNNDRDWQHYSDYRRWFTELKKLLNIGRHPTRNNMRKAKRLDSALVAYGQFLKRYRSDFDAVGQTGASVRAQVGITRPETFAISEKQ